MKILCFTGFINRILSMGVIKNCLDLVHGFSDRWVGVLPLGKEFELNKVFSKEVDVVKNRTVFEGMTRLVTYGTGARCIKRTTCGDGMYISVSNTTKDRFKSVRYLKARWIFSINKVDFLHSRLWSRRRWRLGPFSWKSELSLDNGAD